MHPLTDEQLKLQGRARELAQSAFRPSAAMRPLPARRRFTKGYPTACNVFFRGWKQYHQIPASILPLRITEG
jgi:hypothetical protein